MTAHTEDPGLHKLSAELLHRYQGDTVLWGGEGDMLLVPRQLRTGDMVGSVWLTTYFRSQECTEPTLHHSCPLSGAQTQVQTW